MLLGTPGSTRHQIVCKRTGEGLASKLDGGVCVCKSLDECGLLKEIQTMMEPACDPRVPQIKWKQMARAEFDARKRDELVKCVICKDAWIDPDDLCHIRVLPAPIICMMCGKQMGTEGCANCPHN